MSCKRIGLAVFLSGAFVAAAPAGAALCASDPVPAATLLLPYFHADISDLDKDGKAECRGLDTVFTVANSSFEPALAHVILWTDWSFPTINFDLFLTGFDVQRISLCEVIGRGILPRTADAANDPADSISPHQGPNSDNPAWDGPFPGCSGLLPPTNLIKPVLDYVQNAHAGFPIPLLGNTCAGDQRNGSGQCSGGSCPSGTVVRGYVTVDSANACSIYRSPDPGYFVAGGTGVANNKNILWGDYQYVDHANAFAQGETLVHVEAFDQLDKSQLPLVSPVNGSLVATIVNPNSHSFYAKHASVSDANGREPLGSAWGVRYGSFRGSTQLIVWRDSKFEVSPAGGFACGLCANGAGPPWCPMSDGTQTVCWDEAEDAVELCGFVVNGGIVLDLKCPWDRQTQLVTIGEGEFTPPSASGWCYMNLNHTLDAGDFAPGAAQSYVASLQVLPGRFSVGNTATQLATTCSMANSPLITGNLGVILPP